MYHYFISHSNSNTLTESKEFMEEIVSKYDMGFEILSIYNHPDEIAYTEPSGKNISNSELLENADEYERGSILWWARFLNTDVIYN